MADTDISVSLMVTCGDNAFASVPLEEVDIVSSNDGTFLAYACPFCKENYAIRIAGKE